MADPKWFDADIYMANKLAQMQESDPAYTMTQLEAALADAGLTPYEHFVTYGADEEVSPNADFNAEAYYIAKAAQFNGVKPSEVTESQVQEMVKALDDAGLNAWEHYQLYGTAEGVNPSNSFDTSAYMDAKLAQMQKTAPDYTMAQLEAAFAEAGLSALEHYYLYGQDEGITATAVSGDEVIPAEPKPDPDPVVPGETFDLTTGHDDITGTDGNDVFYAHQQADLISDSRNTLQSGDKIDGGDGDDVLYADLGANTTPTNSQIITPEIKNVEVLKFRVQNGNASDVAKIDAERISAGDDGTLQLWSQDSRNDLTIEDVRVNSNQVTVGMGNTDPGVDMTVHFNDQYLKADDSTTTGTLNLQLIDTVGALPEAQGGHADPLYDNPYTGFKFSLNGKEYTVDFSAYNHATDETPSYEELAAQIQAAIDADATLSGLGLKVSLGDAFQAVVGIGEHKGEQVTGTQIVVTSSQGALTGGSWLASNGLPETNSTSATMSADKVDSCPLIKTDVALDNVGHVQWDDASACLPDDTVFGSQAGDLVIGGMGTRGGVERFDVTVDRGSWLSSMSSTNNTLRMVTVKNGDLNGSDADGNNGNLFIGDTVQADNQTSANEGKSMVDWQDATRMLDFGNGKAGLTDVKLFNATEMQGNVSIAAQLTEASYDKYMKSVDGTASMDSAFAPSGEFKYAFGSGDDTLNMKVNGGLLADRDFQLVIDGGEGNDLIQYVADFATDNQIANQQKLMNVTINGGAGDDVIKTPGSGNVIINAGSGNDTVYADNNGDKAVFVLNAGTNAAARAIDVSSVEGAQPLYNDVLGTTNDTFTIKGTVDAGTHIQMTIDFNGVSITAELASWTAAQAATGSTTITDEMINEAIIKAINNDPVMSKLLVAKDGAGHSLLIESLIDGKMDADSLQITFNALDKDGGSVTLNGWTAPTDYTDAQFATYDVPTYFWTAAQTDAAEAAKAESVTLTLSGDLDANNYSLTWGGQNYTVNGLSSASTIQDLANALGTAQAGGVALNTIATLTVNADGTLTITANDAGNLTGTPAISGTNISSGAIIEGADATGEVQTVDFGTTADVNGGNYVINYNGHEYAFTLNDDAGDAALATALTNAMAEDGTTLGSVANIANGSAATTTDVTITAKGDLVGKDIAEATISKGSINTATGNDSTAHSDNVINGGSGNDVLVLGTGAQSNDTVKFDGNFGHDTIVNFDGNASSAGHDLLDFSAYFAGAFTVGSAAANGIAITDAAALGTKDADNNGSFSVSEVLAALDAAKVGTSEKGGSILYIVDGLEGGDAYHVFTAQVAADGTISGAAEAGTIDLAGVTLGADDIAAYVA